MSASTVTSRDQGFDGEIESFQLKAEEKQHGEDKVQYKLNRFKWKADAALHAEILLLFSGYEYLDKIVQVPYALLDLTVDEVENWASQEERYQEQLVQTTTSHVAGSA